MAREPMTLEEIRTTRPMVDTAKIADTTEADNRRHQIEDGEIPDASLPLIHPILKVPADRTRK